MTLARSLFPVLMVGLLAFPVSGLAESGKTDSWLPTLETATPQEGFALAVKLSRMSVKTTQPNMEVLKEGRKQYSRDPDSLIEASGVVATYFRTVAEANDYWRDQ